MQIFDQEIERHRSPLVIGPVSARTDTAAAIGRARVKIHCGGASAKGTMQRLRDWIRSQIPAANQRRMAFFPAAALSYSARDQRFAQARNGDWSRGPRECPFSEQVFMTLMQKIHRLTDN
ncbi:hypothetical protein [Bradyrhizobium uaiense]|uniref:Uncharacterized protein n=1 Tax=Bradyrhizobium uaiense TaxID=2594946 RepID=A0A6P1BJU3_9BRAD|nr:hypothetical protein [Bradyrhizobium uaiense]NEU98816.1 hypothetical protein [Bradyrhizobium uaiense]